MKLYPSDTIYIFLVISLCALQLYGCHASKQYEKVPPLQKIEDIPAPSWKILADKKIYFGHQSVGRNIVAGIKAIVAKNPEIQLRILETNNVSDFQSPVFAHSRIGENRKPYSKINAFSQFMNSGIGVNADLALFKFCYVDFPQYGFKR